MLEKAVFLSSGNFVNSRAAQPHPALQKMLTRMNERTAQEVAHEQALNVEQLRSLFSIMATGHVALLPDWSNTLHSQIDGVPVRIYDPLPEQAKPICVYLHGGGHVVGSAADYEGICQRLAVATGYWVVSVDYRLAPEHPWPAGLEDAATVCGAVLPWFDAQGLRHQKRLALVGDSGGGALAASLAARFSCDAAAPVIERLALIYPSLDYTLSQPSVALNGHGYLLERERIEWYFAHYFTDWQAQARAASPLFMPFDAHRLPTTLVLTAGFCALRDEGVAWLERITAAGATGLQVHFDDMIHAFMLLEKRVPQSCQMAFEAIGRFLSTAMPVRHAAL